MDRVYTNKISELMTQNGGSCVWLCDVIEGVQADGHTANLAEFAQWAFEAHASYRITLRPCDVTSSMWVTQVLASEIRSQTGAVYHTITRP